MDTKGKYVNAFVRGFGGVLSFHRSDRRSSRLSVARSVAERVTTSEALAEDWRIVGKGILVAIEQARDDERERSR
jgi:hypothetical protein